MGGRRAVGPLEAFPVTGWHLPAVRSTGGSVEPTPAPEWPPEPVRAHGPRQPEAPHLRVRHGPGRLPRDRGGHLADAVRVRAPGRHRGRRRVPAADALRQLPPESNAESM